ncbi:MAG: hypothetical protein JST25_03460 [Actinobacteria bacterium]|nr:hypothetical protein [Actinomycetota bacterium]
MNRSRLRAALTALALAAGLAAAGGVVPAAADETPAPAPSAAPVSWSVVPADASGPDGRISVEHELDPGAGVEDHFAVRNLGKDEVTFRLSAADGYYNAKGRFDILPSDKKSVAAGTWISLPDSVTVPAGGTAVIGYTIAVPQNAEPGDHAAGIAASILSSTKDGGTAVGVESRVGFRVMVRVIGELTPSFAVQKMHADYRTSWNPFRPGSATVSFEVKNTGNARLAVAGALDLAGHAVAFPAAGARAQELLPGESHSFTLDVPEVWPLALLSGELKLAPTSTSASGDALTVSPATTAVSVWAMPWPQLAVLLGVVLIVLALVWRRGRSKRRLEDLLERAREEGRTESKDDPAS